MQSVVITGARPASAGRPQLLLDRGFRVIAGAQAADADRSKPSRREFHPFLFDVTERTRGLGAAREVRAGVGGERCLASSTMLESRHWAAAPFGADESPPDGLNVIGPIISTRPSPVLGAIRRWKESRADRDDRSVAGKKRQPLASAYRPPSTRSRLSKPAPEMMLYEHRCHHRSTGARRRRLDKPMTSTVRLQEFARMLRSKGPQFTSTLVKSGAAGEDRGSDPGGLTSPVQSALPDQPDPMGI